jgi:Fe-S-cluster containining protein
MLLKNEKRSCNRCGSCCEVVCIPFSEKQLYQQYVIRAVQKMAPEPLIKEEKKEKSDLSVLRRPDDWLDAVFYNLKGKAGLDNITSKGIQRDPTDRKDDAFEIYPMLKGRRRGSAGMRGQYVYGPCKNLGYDDEGKATCAIHDKKPKMCSEYPYYKPEQKFDRNPAYIKGCGYNRDIAAGFTVREIVDAANTIQLEDNNGKGNDIQTNI